MTITIKTPVTELEPGDKVFVVGIKRPVEVEHIDCTNRVRYRHRGSTGVAIQKEFDRVVTKMSQVIR